MNTVRIFTIGLLLLVAGCDLYPAAIQCPEDMYPEHNRGVFLFGMLAWEDISCEYRNIQRLQTLGTSK